MADYWSITAGREFLLARLRTERKEGMKMVLVDNGLSEEALGMIVAEDMAQIEKWGYQEHDIFHWLAILSEEVGELNKAVVEHELQAGLWRVLEEVKDFKAQKWAQIEKEATQVATLALKIAWMCRQRTAQIRKQMEGKR